MDATLVKEKYGRTDQKLLVGSVPYLVGTMGFLPLAGRLVFTSLRIIQFIVFIQ